MLSRALRHFSALLLAASCPLFSQTVRSYRSTSDLSSALETQPALSFTHANSTSPLTITVDERSRFQTMDGFGISMTEGSAWLLHNRMPSAMSRDVMTKLFDPSKGIGLSFVRLPIGSTDLSLNHYSYDDMPAGQSDPTLAKFSVAHDQAYILPVLKQALSINPGITIMATPWSPPGWMKTSDSMIGGTLNSGDYQVLADYLTKFIQAYDAAGVPIALITPQNEPEYSPSNYPGSTLTASQEASLIGDNLGPDLQKAGLSTKIIAYDHNWNDTTFPETVLGDPTAGPYTAGVAWHCYAGDPSAQTTVHDAYPNKDTYFTECSGSQSSNPANTFSDSLDWQTENLIIGATRNWAKTVTTWNMALDPSGGPSMNCTTCTAAVTVDNSAGTATYNAEYYVLGQASKFVKPGAVRIGSNTFGSGNLEDVAFQNPDGSDALIALNADTSSARTFNVEENGQYFTYTLPAGAVATFTWTPGSTSTGGGISPSTWYQVVNTHSGDCVDDANGSAANGAAVQQWSCGTGNTNQEWQFQPTSNGYYQVVTRNAPGAVWDVTGGPSATGNGTPIQLWSAAGGTNQQWLPTLQSDGSYTFTVRNSGNECLDVTNRSTSNGTQLQQWACTAGDTAQTFQLVPVS